MTALVCDHKNDLYNNSRVLTLKTQLLSDFQSLCEHCNLQKRQAMKNTKATGIRYSGMNIPCLYPLGIDYISGDGSFDKNDPNAMVGTFWYDPIEFIRVAVSEKMKNSS